MRAPPFGRRAHTALAGVALIAAFALAVVLRLRQATAPMTFDEFASLYFSSHPWRDLWGWWMLRETNPPLFYSLLKIWRAMVPYSQPWLRLLPLLFSLAHIAVVGRLAGKAYGPASAALAILLMALSPSDIFQSEYVRGYTLGGLAVAVSFAGLLDALDGSAHERRAWALYGGGAVVAIYSHTTLLLWPVIATTAAIADAALRREMAWRGLAKLAAANAIVLALSGWAILLAVLQLRSGATNISWIDPLSLADFVSSVNLQLLMDGTVISAIMLGLVAVGLLRTHRDRTTRLAALIVAATLLAFRLADLVHPIISDYTLHWCATFSALLAAASVARVENGARALWLRARWIAVPLAFACVTADGLVELFDYTWMPEPQDFRYTVRTVSGTAHAALLASHESMGVVISQACRLEFRASHCPFPFVVLANPAQSDSWAFGGFDGRIVPTGGVRPALGRAETVYVFSRYDYTPLQQLGIDERRYPRAEWDDGELIGPIPIGAFDGTRPRPSL